MHMMYVEKTRRENLCYCYASMNQGKLLTHQYTGECVYQYVTVYVSVCVCVWLRVCI